MTISQWENEASLQEFRLGIIAWNENVDIDQWKTLLASGIAMACRKTDWHVSVVAFEDAEAAWDRVYWMEICRVKVENQTSFEYENPWKPCRYSGRKASSKACNAQTCRRQSWSVTLRVQPNFSSYEGWTWVCFQSLAGLSYKRESSACDEGTVQTP